jgi:mannose-1-phosphate guanylyltransferase
MLHEELGSLERDAIPPLQTGRAVWIDAEARVSPDSVLRGSVSIGKGSWVREGVEIEDSILWDGIEVRPGSKLRNCIVTDGGVMAGTHENEIHIGSMR